ncbi:hypothetical protein PYW08_008217 [Mythimna loreyi]|uniref:Uncharacterized protein n=1 Tax=Mythimna loreyi TaxID=667449 RepID=A0ACC2QBS0_9NEOP|nr:hypothetical protein PYW08_008217 [Mythimna loreyi]
MWGAVFLLAVAGTALADPQFMFPEDVPKSESRIVSGWEADVGQFPFQLSLRMVSPAGQVFACGGTILTAEWGMTAAHCTAARVTIIIRAGTVNMTQPAAIFETTKYYNHPLYNEAIPSIVQPHDIGLLEFGRSLKFSDLIQPIRIQRSSAKDQNYAGVQAIASGWGVTWTQGSSPENLNWVYLRLVSNEECRAAYGGSNIIADSTICTRGYYSPTQSTCQGDSGGPLTIIDDDGAITQVGVTSFVSGLGCHAGIPSGFIRPGHYLGWFEELTGVNFDWEYETTTEAPEDVTTEGNGDETTDVTPESVESPEDVPSQESEESAASSQSSESAASQSSESAASSDSSD